MRVLFEIVLPVFGLVLTGYIAGHFRILGGSAAAAINRFVFYFALPAVLFTFAARAPVAESLNWPFIGTFLGGTLITFAGAFAISRSAFRNDAAASIMHGYAAIFANTVFLGIPLFLMAFGEQGTIPAITAALCLLVMIAGIIAGVDVCLNRSAASGRVVRDIAGSLIRNPLLIAAASGVLFSALELSIPKGIGTYLDMLGHAATPTALFTLGLSLVGRPLAADMREVSWMVFVKLVAHPLAVGLLGAFVFNLDERWLQSAVLLAALPSGTLVYVVAQRFDIFVGRASAVIMVSTALSMVTVAGLLIWIL
jgi:hypothetical protein